MCAHSFMYVQPYSALELWVGDVCGGGVYNVARNEERSVMLRVGVPGARAHVRRARARRARARDCVNRTVRSCSLSSKG